MSAAVAMFRGRGSMHTRNALERGLGTASRLLITGALCVHCSTMPEGSQSDT